MVEVKDQYLSMCYDLYTHAGTHIHTEAHVHTHTHFYDCANHQIYVSVEELLGCFLTQYAYKYIDLQSSFSTGKGGSNIHVVTYLID